MSAVDAVTHMFIAKTDAAKAALAKEQGRIDQNGADHTAAVAGREAVLDEIAEQGDTPERQAALREHNERIAFLADMAPRLQARLVKAQQALADAVDADAAKKRKEFNKSHLKSFDQHIAEAKHCLAPIPQTLEMLNKAVFEGMAANEKAAALSSRDPVDVPRTLGRAIKAAGLEQILRDALNAAQGGQTHMNGVAGHFEGRVFVPDADTEIRHMAEEVSTALKQSRSAYELELGLRELTPEEKAEKQKAERDEVERQDALWRRQRQLEHHMKRLAEDPAYFAQHFPVPGSAPPPPPGDVSRLVQRAAEHGTATAQDTAMRGPMPDDRQPDTLAQVADKYRYPVDLPTPEPMAPPTAPSPAADDDAEDRRRTAILEAAAAETRAERQRWANPE